MKTSMGKWVLGVALLAATHAASAIVLLDGNELRLPPVMHVVQQPNRSFVIRVIHAHQPLANLRASTTSAMTTIAPVTTR